MRKRQILTLAAIIALLPCAAVAQEQARQGEESRTAGRTTTGAEIYPPYVFAVPEHYEFLPDTSNHDTTTRHPQQWKGQDWDTTAWEQAPGRPRDRWTPAGTIQKFFDGRIFHRRYMRGEIPVLELGPTFYKLSDLNQRRALKLLADHDKALEKGPGMIELRDWYTRKVVGSYTAKGMLLD